MYLPINALTPHKLLPESKFNLFQIQLNTPNTQYITIEKGGNSMNKHTKIALCVLAIFIVGMTLSVAFAEPVNAKKYKHKKKITVKVKDGKKTIKVKCKYKKSLKQYLGHKYKNGKRYDVCVCYEYKDGMQGGKKGWWTDATNGGMEDWAKTGAAHNKHHPVKKVRIY